MSHAEGARAAIAYLRVAGAGAQADEQELAPVDSQRRTIEAWAGREGVEIRSWGLDVGVGGDTPIAERPGLLAAYAAVREHRAGILVAANAERFSQDELVAWLIERAALTEGAILRTADGSRPPQRSLSAEAAAEDLGYSRPVLELARAHERVVFRSRVRAALARKKARGERVGTVPFGYRLAADGVHLEPDAGEQGIVEAVRALSAEGLSQRAIARTLAERGVTGRTGAALGQTQVGTILRSAR